MSFLAKVSALGNDVTQVAAFEIENSITLSQPSQVLLQLAPEDVLSMLRDGNDLVIETASGETLRIVGFYNDMPGGAESELYLTGTNDRLIPVELTTLSDGSVTYVSYYPEGEYSGFEHSREKAGFYAEDAVLPLALGAVGVTGIAAANSSSSSSTPPAVDDDEPVDDSEDDAGDPADPDIPPDGGPTDPEVPGDPDDPDVPGDPDDPDVPGDPDDPDVPGDPDDPDVPGDPDDPDVPGDPDDPDVPGDPDDPDVPGDPDDPDVPGDPDDPDVPGDPDDPDVPGDPDDPDVPGDPDDPTTPPPPTLALVNDTGRAVDGITRDGTIEVANLEEGATWEFSLDGGETWLTGEGNSFVLPEGDYPAGQVRARQTNAEGVTSELGILGSVVIDTTAPASPTLTLANDTGDIDGVTTDGTLLVSNLESGALWEFSLDGGDTWQAGSGDRFILPEGEYAQGQVQIRQTDAAGNVSDVTEFGPVTIDLVIDDPDDPDLPAIPTLTLAEDTGSAIDGITSNGTVLVGGLVEGGTWEISLDGGNSWQTGTGESFELAEGTYAAGQILVRQTDADGNTSGTRTLGAVIIDQTPPNAPTLALANNTGDDDTVTSDGTLLVEGLEPGATWEFSLDGGDTWQAGTGDRFILPEGDYSAGQVQVRQTDAAGNVSEVVSLGPISVDPAIIDPVDPVVIDAPTLTLVEDTGSAIDGITSNGTVEVGGLVEGATWEISLDGGQSWQAGEGVNFVLPEGSYSAGQVLVRQRDANGNVSDPGALGSVVIDTTAPASPTLTLANDTGDIDGVTTDGTLLVSNLEPGALWEFSLDGGNTWQAGSGDRFILPEGEYAQGQVQIRQTDAAGNVSDVTEFGPVTVDLVIDDPDDPDLPAIPTLTLAEDTGSAIDGITSNGTVLVGGLVEGGTWEISLDGGNSWQTGTGESFELAEGTYAAGQVLVRQTDADGNTSGTRTLGAVIIDQTPPNAPILALANNTGDDDSVTSDGTLLVEGLEPGATWAFSLDGGDSWQAGTGDRFILPEGDYSAGQVQVRQTDAAGNVSQIGELGAITIDPGLPLPEEPDTPATPSLSLIEDTSGSEGITSNGSVLVGDLEPGNRWEYSLDNGATWVAGQGDRFVLPEGDYSQGQVQVRQINAAGNTSAAGVLDAVVVDTTAPVTPTTVLENDTGDVDGITSDGTVNVDNLEPGARWQYSLDGGDTWLEGESASFLLQEGVYATRQVLVRQFDTAGNVSGTSNLGAVIVDTTAPDAPLLNLLDDTGGVDGVTANGTVIVGELEPGTAWEYSLDSGATWLRGSGDRFILAEGSYAAGQVQARQIDAAGNVSDVTEFGPVTVDLIVDNPDDPDLPAIPTLALVDDTGELDGITADGTVLVGGLVEGGSWEFSLDGGQTWQAGLGDTFELPEGDYTTGQILVRQTDADGLTSGTRTLGSVIVDTTAPDAPTIEVANDTGDIEGITADGTIVIGNLEPGGYWEVSLDGGQTWQRGVGDRFILPEGDYAGGQVQVRQGDQAGNTSEAMSLDPLTVDLTAPRIPTLQLDSDAAITNDPTVTIGNLEAGAVWEFSLDGGNTWATGSGTSFELPEGEFEDGQVLVRQVDGAGNVSPIASLAPVIIDITPPVTPELSLSGDSVITNDGTVTVDGIEPDATWEYSLNGGATWIAGEGTSFVLPEGEYAAGRILVRQTDTAGNVSAPANLSTVIVDTTPPPAPLLTLASIAGDDGVTADGTVLLGNLDPNARWEVSLDGGQSWQPGSGDRFVLPPGAYDEGQVQARQIDAAGNVSSVTGLGPVTVDLTIEPPTDPQAPATPTLALANDTGDVDNITSDGSVLVSGLVEGGTWEYSLDGGANWLTGQGSGFDLPEGTYPAGQVLVRQTDAAGVTSGTSTLGTVIIDTTAPAAPTITLETDTGELDGVTANGAVRIGNLDPAATWEISLDGGTTWLRGTGERYLLPEGEYAAGDILVRQTDSAGNVSDATPLGAVTVVTQPPQAPTIDLVGGDLTNDGTVTVDGLQPGATWEYSLDGGNTWQTGQNDSFVLPEGNYSAGQVQVRQIDGAGNIGAVSQLDAVTIDLTPPAAPTATLANPSAITNDGTVEVGNLEPGATWEYSLDGGQSWIIGEGSRFVLAEGEYLPNQVQVRQTDGAGNIGKPLALGALVVDTTAPEVPTLALANDTGSIDGVTADGTVRVGNLDPDARWEYSLDNGETWVRGVGESFVLPQGSYGDGQVQARQVDAAGNASAPTALGPVTVELTLDPPADPDAPAAPVISLDGDTGDVDGITNDGLIQVSGLLDGATWQYSLNAGTSWFSGFGTSFNLPEGVYPAGQVLVRQIGPDGRTSATSTLGSLTVDTTPPDAPIATLRNDTGEIDGVTTDGTLLIDNLEAGARWEISLNGGASWQFGTGNRFILPEGRYAAGDIRIRQIDAAGNVSDTSLLSAIEVDNVLPDAPTLELVGGAVNNDGVVLVEGIEEGARWEYSLDGGASWLLGRGTSFTLPEGRYAEGAIQIRQIDGAGNVSAPAQLPDVVIDLTPPAAPTAQLVDASPITNDGTVTIGGLEEGATWEYSLDGGETWQTGTGTSFTLPEGDYAAGSVQVRQTDVAGNTGAPASLGAVVIDTTAPDAPTLSLVNDTGEIGDGVTADGTIDVGNLEPGAFWEYSLDGGDTWQRGLGDRFVLPEGEYVDGQVQVRQTDAAGNVSEPAAFGPIAVDLTITPPVEPEAPATPTLALAEDTGELDNVTSNGLVNVSGLVEGVIWEYSLDGGDSWVAGTGTSFTLDEGTYAGGQVLVRQTENGLTSGTSTLGAVTIDTTAPETPSVALVNDTGALDGITADGTLLIGNLEPGTFWEISLDGGDTWQAGTGDRFILPQASYEAGAIVVRQTDGAGNVSDSGSAGAISVITTPPAAPTVTLGGEAPFTNDATVEVDGIADGATWEYTLDGGDTWLPGTGTSFELPEAEYLAGDIQVRQIDGAGNVSSPALVGAVVIDQTPPAAPTITPADDSPITNDGTVTIGGLEEGATWEYSLDGGDTWQTGTGTSFILPEGDYTAGDVQVRQIDRAGNIGDPVELGAVVIDITPPAAPTIASLGDSPITNDGAIEVTDLEPDATWEYSLDGGETWQTGTGTSFTLPEGDYAAGSVQVRQTDAAGNTGAPASLGAVVIDTTAPDAPTLNLVNDTGEIGDGVTADGTIDVGNLEPGASWEYSLDGGDTWQRGLGDRFVLPEGDYLDGQVQVRQTDAAGNVSEPAAFGPIAVDLTITPPLEPEAPATPTLALAEDTGELANVTSNGLVNVSGLVEGATWEYSLDGGDSWVAGTGTSFTLDEGTYAGGQVLVRQTENGLTSGTSTLGAVTIDTTAPDAPTVALVNDTGALDGITADGTLLIGNLEPGAFWEISLDGGDTWQAGTGDRFILPQGSYEAGAIVVRQTDGAGNVSDSGSAGAISVITTPPAAPTVTLGGEAPFTSDATVEVDGIADGATWEYTLDGGATWLPGTGTTFELPEAEYLAGDIQVRQIDGAGNVSSPALVGAVVVDLTPPAAPVIDLVDDSPITNNGTVTIGGLEDGATWEYSLDGGESWQTGTGTSFTLPEGDYAAGSVQVRQTDVAGNTGAPASLGAVVIDTTAPDTPTLSLVNDTGEIGDGVTADGTIDVGNLEPDASWEYSLDGGDTWQRGLGDRFVLPEGDYLDGQVQVRQTDAAGNVSEPAAFGPISVDLTITPPVEPEAPATPTLALAEDTGELDNVTSNGLVNVSGLVEGATWEYSLDGGDSWIAGTGTSFTLDEGTYAGGQVLVRQTENGLTSGTSTLGAVTIDTTAPETPSVALVNDTGALDGITTDGTLLVGNLEPGAFWEISLDGGDTWQAGTGDRFILPQGSYETGAIVVRQTDGAGNVSESATAGAISVITTPPAAPTVTLGGEAPFTNDATVEVDGIADGATWEYTLDGGDTWLPGTGTTFELPEAEYLAGDIQVRQIDGAGNVSASALVGAVVVDLTPPAAPVIDLVDDSPITNDGTVTIGGLEEGATWEYSLDGGESWQTGTGVSFTLPEGDYTTGDVQVRQIDRAGNIGDPVELGAVVIDTTPPAMPLATLALDGDIINDGTVSVAGLEPEAIWEVSLDGGTTWQVGEGDGFTLPDGSYAQNAIQVRQVDAAGNQSPIATLGPVVIDTVAPAAPELSLVSDTGDIGDGVTADGTIDVGNLEPDASWEYSLDGGDTWQAGTGDRFVLPEGTYAAGDVQVRQFDAAGNESPITEFGAITVDLTIDPPVEPEAPPAPLLTLEEDTGALDGVTANGTVNVGNLVDGGSWEYSLDGGDTWVDGAGASFVLPENAYSAGEVQVRQTSADGLTSATRVLPAVTVDTTAPDAPVLTLVSDTGEVEGVTADGTVRVEGLEENASWEYSLDGGTTWQAGTGSSFVLPEGDYATGQVQVRQIDGAGNTSGSGELAPVTVDTTSPGGEGGTDAPYIVLPELLRGYINAEAAEGGIELGVMLTSGTQAGDTLTLSLAGTDDVVEFDYTVTSDDVDAGMMVVALGDGNSDGRYTVSARITDGAGNASSVSNAIDFVLDTIPPNATTTQIVLDPITGDNVVNFAESVQSVVITGRVIGEFRANDTLNITVNDGEYTTNVGANGTFSVSVLGSLLASATPPVVAFELLATDEAGNVGVIEADYEFEVNLEIPIITIDPLTGDNVINGQNIAGGLVVTGTVEGAPAGATVTLSIAGATFEGRVVDGAWSARVPAAYLEDVANGTFELVATVANEVGNVGQSAPVEVLLDTVRPTAAITISDTLIGSGEVALVTFTFSEAVTDFTLGDIQVAGGTLANLATDNGLVWTADFQPAASGQASITLPGGSYTDVAGNPGNGASLGGITVDLDPPSLTSISFAVGGRPLTSAETTEVTFTFSEAVTGLALNDFAVTGGRLYNLTSVNGGATWTATFKPDGLASSASITLANGSYTDLAGNPGTGGVSPILAITILQPVLMIDAADDGWINGVEANGAEVQVGFGGLPVSQGDVVTLNVLARAGGGLAVGTNIATVSYVLTQTDVANGYATFALDIGPEYTFQPAGAQVQIGGSALSQEVDFVIDTVPPGRAVTGNVEVAGNGIVLDTVLNPGEGIRLRIEDNEDTVRLLDTRNYPGLVTQNASGQYVLNLFALALNLQELLGDDLGDLLDLRSLDLQLSTYDRAGNEGEIVTLNDLNILGPVVSLLDFTGSLVGVTDPGASVAVSVRLAGVTQTITVGADANGAFEVDLLADPRLSFSLNDLLQASVTAVATDAQGNRTFSPVTANLVELLPVPLSTLDLSPITNLVVGGAGVVGALSNVVLPQGSTLAASLEVGGLTSVNVPVTAGPGGALTVNLGAALNSAVTSLNLLGGVTGLLTGRGTVLTLEYTSPEGVVGTTEVTLLGSSLASLTFGNVRETTINGTPDADVLIAGAGQSVQALGGNDLIVLRSDAFVSIDGGAGLNTLLVEGRQNLDLADFGRMSNIQRVNLGNTGSTLTLNAETANALAGDSGTLQILGGATNSLNISGAAVLGSTTVIDGVTYRQVELGDTTLLINQGIALDFVPTINQTAGYIISGGGEAGVAVAVQVGTTTYNTRVDADGEWRLVLNQPAAAGSQIRAVVGGDATETVSVPVSVAPPTGLQIRTPPLLGLLQSFLEGSAVGAQTVRLDVYQDDLFTSLRSTTINVNSNGSFSVGTSVLSNLLNSATGLLVGNQGVNVGFTAERSNGSHSTTEVVHFGTAESVFANPLTAITNTLGGVIGGVLGSTSPLPVSNSFYDGSDRAEIVQGSARNQIFNTDDGNDVVISTGGQDVINTGSGDDVIVLRHTQFASIDGGDGFDIVALGAGINLNLTSTLGDIRNVERISLGKANGTNTLRLARQDLIELTDSDNVLQVTGDGQDRVELAGGSWARTGTAQTIGGVVFNEYVNQDGVLFVEQGINVVEVA
ncbi:Ig-like domain-containing protein [Halomonas aquamarina]|uniref:Ig-like domain-containing protein n=1 Tax=Vreelandella aquamarina TaxID=77097 RepID=A0ACC5VRH9_9GAMM|nr:Ig-like domain-containing protein [Halomonas aquamarina]MBZ5486524.1 Ig-like domain-containing protein [Halomonas aquamarina]